MKTKPPCPISRTVMAILAGLVLLPGPVWAAEKPVRVLVLTGQNNHDWAATTEQIKTILLRDGRFVVDVTERPENLDKSAGEKYDVLLSNWNTWGKTGAKEWPPATREAFLSFVREGRGLVVVHAGSSSFLDWDDYQNLVGGTWGKETGHGAVHTFTVKMTDQEHPITRGIEPFEITDELWHRTALRSPRILATAFSVVEKGGSGRDEPVAFVTEFGKGRGFNLVLGHDVRAMQAEGFQVLLRRGTEWAATGKVTVPARGPATGADRQAVPEEKKGPL